MPDEKLPRIRRRIGAAFKLDEGLIHLDSQVRATIVVDDRAKEPSTHELKLNVRTCLYRRIQSCIRWKLTWLYSSRFMRRLANSHWRRNSANRRRRAGCSSARGRRRKWRTCRRPWSSTGSRASATPRASASHPVKTKVREAAAPCRPMCTLHSGTD